MTTSETCSLKWNDFRDNVSTAFGSLRDNADFSDVTLACEDGQQALAHKVILAASSPFFRSLLIQNKHSHPLIYMKGIKYEDLLSILDFLYYGEANICQENLESFFKLAEEIKLNWLAGGFPAATVADEQNYEEIVIKSDIIVEEPIQNKTKKQEDMNRGEASLENENGKGIEIAHERASAISKQNIAGDFKEMDEKIQTMMTYGKTFSKDGRRKNYACTVCGKEDKYTNIKNHIETNHLEGVSIPCNFCEKTFRSRDAIRQHNSHYHKYK